MITLIVNAAANLLILMGAGSFYLMLFSSFGYGKKMVDNFPKIGYYILKVGLAFIVTGAFFNVITIPTPTLSELGLHVGLGCLFTWAPLYHGKKFGAITMTTGLTSVMSLEDIRRMRK